MGQESLAMQVLQYQPFLVLSVCRFSYSAGDMFAHLMWCHLPHVLQRTARWFLATAFEQAPHGLRTGPGFG